MKNFRDWRRGRRDVRSIKARLTGVVLVPSIALLLLWAGVSGVLIYEGLYVRAVVSGVKNVSIPAVEVLKSAQAERSLSMASLSRAEAGRDELDRQRVQTDRALVAMKGAADPLLDASPQNVRDRMQALNGIIGQLGTIRAQTDAKKVDRHQVYEFYNRFLDAGTDLFETQARAVPGEELVQGGLSATALFRAADLMSRASSLASNSFATGSMSPADHDDFSRLVGGYHLYLDSTISAVAPPVRKQFDDITAGADWTKLVAVETQLVNTGPWTLVQPVGRRGQQPVVTPPIIEEDWTVVAGPVAGGLFSLAVNQAMHTSDQGLIDGNTQLRNAILGSVVALLVAALAVIVALRVSRKLVRRLNRLRDETLELAGERLPELVHRLRDGAKVDIATQMPALDFGNDEIGQVAKAFNTAQATAVTAAVQESQAREGVSKVFLGIAHRSQALVHRQLKILDDLEREQEDPQQLDALFRLDHLATRARRNAENLIILGGGQPGRKWRRPVVLADILRSATAETEHYARVRLHGNPRVLVAGTAVTDVVHLLAELLDNATSFSPPRSQVRLQSEIVARGVAVEVEDNGLGMSDADRDRANTMLADPPEFDAMALKGESRLGLFVVARLAVKHNVKVELRSSSYGGTRAIVLIPNALIDGVDDRDDDPSTEFLRPVPPQSRTGTELPAAVLFSPMDSSSEIEPIVAEVRSDLTELWAPSVAAAVSGEEAARDAVREAVTRELPPLPNRNNRHASANSGPVWPEPASAAVPNPAGPNPAVPNPAVPNPAAPKSVPPAESAVARQPVAREPVTRSQPPSEPMPKAQVPPARPPRVPPREPAPGEKPVLPKRRRQSNLAPQLRDSVFEPADSTAEPDAGRSPEAIRDMMSAFQRNSNRARAQDPTEL